MSPKKKNDSKQTKKATSNKKASSNKKPPVKKTNTTAANRKKTVTSKKSDKTAKKKTTTTTTTTKAKPKTTKKKFETKKKNTNSKTSKKENSNSSKSSVKKTNTTAAAAANKKKNDKNSTTTTKSTASKKKQTSKTSASGSASAAAAADDYDYEFWEEPKNIPKWMKEIRSETRRFNRQLKLETTSMSHRSIKRFCKHLQTYVCDNHPESEEHTTVAKDALVWVSTFIKDSYTARAWCDAVYVIIQSDDVEFINDEVFGGAEVRDALLNVAKYLLVDPDSVEEVPSDDDDNDFFWKSDYYNYDCFDPSEYVPEFEPIDVVGSWCRAAARCVQNDLSNRDVFGRKEIRDVVISLYEHVTPMTICEWFYLVRSLMEKNQELFGVVEMRDVLIEVSLDIADEGSTAKEYFVEYFVEILYHIFAPDDKDVNKMFAVEEFEQLLLDVSDQIKTSNDAFYWCQVVDNILLANPNRLYEDDKVAALAVLNVATMNHSGLIHTPESLHSALSLIDRLLRVSDGAFFDDYFPQIRHVVKIFKQFVTDPLFTKKLDGCGKNDFFLSKYNEFRMFDYDDDHENDEDDGNKITGKQFVNNVLINESKQLIIDIEKNLKTTL